MTDYSKAKIYKICDVNEEMIYIGSTTKQLLRRMSQHKADYKIWKKNGNKFVSSYVIFEKYGIENCCIYLIDSVICSDKEELRAIEGKYIRNLDCVNKNIPDRKKKEWIKDHTEDIQTYHKIYRENNMEYLNIKAKEWREIHSEEKKANDKLYYEKNKDEIKTKHDIYNKNNHDKIKERTKIYYEKNKKYISESRNKKYICECGCETSKKNQSRHIKSKVHLKNVVQ